MTRAAARRQSIGWMALPAILAMAAQTGCGSTRPVPPLRPAADDARLASIVLTADQVRSSGTVLAAMRGRVPSMRVSRSSDCPGITLRSARIPDVDTAPLVYIDGNRTAGTCALVELPPRDVDRVEVYPMGVTTRPGYARNSNGLILIFMKGR